MRWLVITAIFMFLFALAASGNGDSGGEHQSFDYGDYT